MKLVVGLGNPGQKYQNTRHNVGFDVVGTLANRYSGSSPRVKHDAELVEITVPLTDGESEKVLLVAPITYMNESGRAVGKLVDFYQLETNDVLVICDDLNLDVGRLRLRGSGSAGGQKGLNNIIQRLGTQDIPRLRIGIDRPPPGWETASYVLSKFKPTERDLMEETIVRAADAVEHWLKENLDVAMSRVNAPPEDQH